MSLENTIPQGYIAIAEMDSPYTTSTPSGTWRDHVDELTLVGYRSSVGSFPRVAEFFKTQAYRNMRQLAKASITQICEKSSIKTFHDREYQVDILAIPEDKAPEMMTLTKQLIADMNTLYKDAGSKRDRFFIQPLADLNGKK